MTVDCLNVELSQALEEVHFSGGLKGFPTNHGWVLLPISSNPNANALVFKSSSDHYNFATYECGLKYLGSSINYSSDPTLSEMIIWEFGERDPANKLSAADSWSCIKINASQAGDEYYASLASYISSSLRSAGLRLRSLSNRYHEQLKYALLKNKKIGSWFSNIALHEIYTDFHSLASELSSGRDHLARVVAFHVCAPSNIDSLAKLEAWLKKPANKPHEKHPMIQLMLNSLGSKESPLWLRRMGEIRNEMLHRIPMGSNKAVCSFTLESVSTSQGEISRIRLGDPSSPPSSSQQPEDPLVELSDISWKFEKLCRDAWKLSKYPATLVEIQPSKK